MMAHHGIRAFSTGIGRSSKSILVINCGSSSVKFQVVDPRSREVKIGGVAERLTTDNAFIKYKTKAEKEKVKVDLGLADHKTAFEKVKELVSQHDFIAVGHRVVHGGETFR